MPIGFAVGLIVGLTIGLLVANVLFVWLGNASARKNVRSMCALQKELAEQRRLMIEQQTSLDWWKSGGERDG